MATRLDQASLVARIERSDLSNHMDASESVNYARELLRIRAAVFEVKYPELKAMALIPKNTEVSDTDEQYAYRVSREYGMTALGSSYQGTAPRADVSSSESTPQGIKPITASYGFDFQEAKVAARLGNQLPQRKANAARKAIAQEINRILTFGDSTKYGIAMQGLLTLSGTEVYTVPNGAGASPTWALKTSDEILADMNAIVTQIVVNSNDVEHPDTMLLPLASYHLISTRRLGDGSDVTILKHFLANSPHITTVEPWYALDAAPAGQWTGKRMMVYHKSPDVLESLVPVEFDQFAPQVRDMETITNCHARCGGVVVYRPKAIAYGDGI